jgi:hypothetical protein
MMLVSFIVRPRKIVPKVVKSGRCMSTGVHTVREAGMAQKRESGTREAPKKEIVDTPQEDAEPTMAACDVWSRA